jgi:acyl dehydratase
MSAPALPPGTVVSAPFRAMTRERMRWYVDAQPTVAADDGRIHTQEPTIHDDDDYARAQGLPGIIADGMVSTNWVQGLLIDVFGPRITGRSRLSTKYIAPVYENDRIRPMLEVESVRQEGEGATVVQCKVWCEDDGGRIVTVGAATVWL